MSAAVPVEGRAVLGRVDLSIDAVDTDAQHLDEDATPAEDVRPRRFRELRAVRAVGLTGQYGDRLHDGLRCPDCRSCFAVCGETVKLGKLAFDADASACPADVPEDLVAGILAAWRLPSEEDA